MSDTSARSTDKRREGDAAASTGRSNEEAHLVRAALALADDHRATCPGASCTITLTSLAVLLQRAGINLTPDEYGRLL